MHKHIAVSTNNRNRIFGSVWRSSFSKQYEKCILFHDKWKENVYEEIDMYVNENGRSLMHTRK